MISTFYTREQKSSAIKPKFEIWTISVGSCAFGRFWSPTVCVHDLVKITKRNMICGSFQIYVWNYLYVYTGKICFWGNGTALFHMQDLTAMPVQRGSMNV